MGIEMLQSYIETNCPSACVPVDLFKIARNMAFPNPGMRPLSDYRIPFEYQEYFYPTPLCLVMDAECCLDRLYGGFFGDWVCGGQWNRMMEFLTTFFHVLASNNIKVIVFLNGATESHRIEKWIEKQRTDKEKITQVLRHVAVKGTPPPKVWWVPPSCLRSCLRMILRYLNVKMLVTSSDHHQEVMAYIRKNHYHGLLAADSEYFAFDPPRYFNAELLKLTFKGCLETKEYILNEVTRCLNLHPSRICIVAALIGNHILSENDLANFHRTLCPDFKGKVPSNTLIKAVVDFIRNIPSVDDLDLVSRLVFGYNSPEKAERFKRCVYYYAKGNRHAIRFNTTNSPGYSQASGTSASHLVPDNYASDKSRSPLLPIPTSGSDSSASQGSTSNSNSSGPGKDSLDETTDASKFASETAESELSSLEAYRQVLGKPKHDSSLYHILSHHDDSDSMDGYTCIYSNNSGEDECVISNCQEFETDSLPAHNTDAATARASCVTSLEAGVAAINLNCKTKKNNKNPSQKTVNEIIPTFPKVSADVMTLARERHAKGIMNPAILPLLTQGEIRIPTTFEDDIARDLPPPHLLFRPLRQLVYGILFNHHHRHFISEKSEKPREDPGPEVLIKEWVWSKGNKYNKPDLVPCTYLGWPVPTVTRLWFGEGHEYNKKRIHAFFTCMRSNSRLMRNTNYVPQHCIILCCVLRYMMSNPEGCVLRKQELDAFLVQAVNPHLNDVAETQKLELPLITTRGVQLGALFMQGVENALFANDACGAPIPWLMCCPWLFFDGKIFHRMLLKANAAKNLIDLCDNRIDEVAKVERMRTAVLEGLHFQFAIPGTGPHRTLPFPNFPVPVPGMAGRGRGHQRVVPRGGQLEVAGVVVGSWGPNYGQGPRSPTRNIPPQVVSVGGASRGRGNNNLVHGIGRGNPLVRPTGLQLNKQFSTGIKTKPRTQNLASDAMTVLRGAGRGCSLQIDSQNLDFGPPPPLINPHLPSDHEPSNCWKGPYTNEKDV